MKIWLWIMIFFLCWIPKKEFYPSGALKNIVYSTNLLRIFWWIIIGILVWKGI